MKSAIVVSIIFLKMDDKRKGISLNAKYETK
jgi:hypothetical protein